MYIFDIFLGWFDNKKRVCPLAHHADIDTRDCYIPTDGDCPYWQNCVEAEKWHRGQPQRDVEEAARRKAYEESGDLDDIPF